MELFKYQEEDYFTIQHMDYVNFSDERRDKISNPKKKHRVFVESHSYHSQNQYLQNYGNRLATVRKNYFMIVVERKEHKVSIKIFEGYRLRIRGNSWFKISKSLHYLTFNLDNGDYYYGTLIGYQKKKKCKKILKKNNHHIKPLTLIKHKLREILRTSKKIISSDHLIDEVVNIFISQISNDSSGCYHKDDVLLKSYLDRKSIKYPDNFNVFYRDFEYLTPYKIIKKNNLKIVDAFMEYNNISGKNLKKALHISNNLNISLLKFSYNIFGDQTINKDFELILKILNYTVDFTYISFYFDIGENVFSKNELSKVLDLFRNEVLDSKIDINTFRDHISLYVRLKEYGELSLRWKSTNHLEFREEHLDWSDKIEYYVRGKYYRIYPSKLSELISNQIKLNDNSYFPILLDFSDDYNRESLIQSNCVKTYIGRPESIIISVRKGDIESEERATVEYVIEKDNSSEIIRCKRKQSLGKYNQRLSSEWNEVLSKLDERLSLFVRDDIFDTVKIKKVCSNGHELYSDSHWDEDGRLRWSYKSIE